MMAVLKWVATTRQGPTTTARFLYLASGVMMLTMCSLFALPFAVDESSATPVFDGPADGYPTFTNAVTPVLSSLFPGAVFPPVLPIDPVWQPLVAMLTEQADMFVANRASDGSSASMPIVNPNGDRTIVPGQPLETPLPEPLLWTPLKVNDKTQKFLTPQWGFVKGLVEPEDEQRLAMLANDMFPTPAQRELELNEIKQLSYSNEQRMIAELWAGGPGTVTPPGIWALLTIKAVLSAGFDWNKQVSVLFMVASALFQASITAWRVKREKMQARPIQVIMEQPEQTVTSWKGEVSSKVWVPYQETDFVTPPFPDYISGHSTFSGAASVVLESCMNNKGPCAAMLRFTKEELLLMSPMFGRSELYDRMNVCSDACIVCAKNISMIDTEYPYTTLMFTYSTWAEMAQQCGVSRIYGGIHTQSANAGGLVVGQEIGRLIAQRFALFA